MRGNVALQVIRLMFAGFLVVVIWFGVRTGQVGPNWPLRPFDRANSPESFWGTIALYSALALASAGSAVIDFVQGF